MFVGGVLSTQLLTLIGPYHMRLVAMGCLTEAGCCLVHDAYLYRVHVMDACRVIAAAMVMTGTDLQPPSPPTSSQGRPGPADGCSQDMPPITHQTHMGGGKWKLAAGGGHDGSVIGSHAGLVLGARTGAVTIVNVVDDDPAPRSEVRRPLASVLPPLLRPHIPTP